MGVAGAGFQITRNIVQGIVKGRSVTRQNKITETSDILHNQYIYSSPGINELKWSEWTTFRKSSLFISLTSQFIYT